jgi:dynein heavy chain
MYIFAFQVSRCGMIYMEPATLGWRPLVKSWINTLPTTLTEMHRSTLWDLFDRFVDAMLVLIRKHVRVRGCTLNSFKTSFLP